MFSFPLSLRLKPYTSYKLRMMATNDIGDSKYSKETDAVTTLQDSEWSPTEDDVHTQGLWAA